MPFFWQKSASAVRDENTYMAVEEKLIGRPAHVPQLTDEEAHIIHNLVELYLIDADEEEIFLRRKANQAGICLDERQERRVDEEGCPLSRLVVRRPAGSMWSLWLHVLAVLFAYMARRYLSQTEELLRANKFKTDAEAEAHSWENILYRRFWANGAADVLPLLVVPMVWLAVQSLVRVCRRSVAPLFSSIYEITMTVLLIYFPTVPIAMDGYKWQEVLDTFGGSVPVEERINTLERLARQYKLTGLLFVYPIAAIYVVLIATRILTATATLARGTAAPGTAMYWLHRRGHTAAIGLHLIGAILAAVGASMNIWNGMWYSWHQDMEHITATWTGSGFPLQTIFLLEQVFAFLGLAIWAIAGGAPSVRMCRHFSTLLAAALAYTVYTCTLGIIKMEGESNTWAAQTTKPRHMVAVSMAAIVCLINTCIALFPALTSQAAY